VKERFNELKELKAVIEKIIDFGLSPFCLDIDFSQFMKKDLFSEVTKRIYLGVRPDDILVTELEEVGITHVVSCLNEEKRPSVEFLKNRFNHLFIGVRDRIDEDISAVFPMFFAFSESIRNKKANSKLFVHCEAGVSRSATLIIALLMKLEGKGFFDTYLSVKSKRARILPNIGFASQLQAMEHVLLENKISKSPSSLALYLHRSCNIPADIGTIQYALERNSFDAVNAIKSIFGGEIPRVVQGVRF